jgi:hypothetical protein
MIQNNPDDILFLINDAINDVINDANDKDDKKKLNNNLEINSDNVVITFYNFENCKNNIKYYLEKKKRKLYNKLNKIYLNNYNEYINDIYYFNQNYFKEINKIKFDDNFDYKFNYEIRNNIKYDYNIIKLRLENI